MLLRLARVANTTASVSKTPTVRQRLAVQSTSSHAPHYVQFPEKVAGYKQEDVVTETESRWDWTIDSNPELARTTDTSEFGLKPQKQVKKIDFQAMSENFNVPQKPEEEEYEFPADLDKIPARGLSPEMRALMNPNPIKAAIDMFSSAENIPISSPSATMEPKVLKNLKSTLAKLYPGRFNSEKVAEEKVGVKSVQKKEEEKHSSTESPPPEEIAEEEFSETTEIWLDSRETVEEKKPIINEEKSSESAASPPPNGPSLNAIHSLDKEGENEKTTDTQLTALGAVDSTSAQAPPEEESIILVSEEADIPLKAPNALKKSKHPGIGSVGEKFKGKRKKASDTKEAIAEDAPDETLDALKPLDKPVTVSRETLELEVAIPQTKDEKVPSTLKKKLETRSKSSTERVEKESVDVDTAPHTIPILSIGDEEKEKPLLEESADTSVETNIGSPDNIFKAHVLESIVKATDRTESAKKKTTQNTNKSRAKNEDVNRNSLLKTIGFIAGVVGIVVLSAIALVASSFMVFQTSTQACNIITAMVPTTPTQGM